MSVCHLSDPELEAHLNALSVSHPFSQELAKAAGKLKPKKVAQNPKGTLTVVFGQKYRFAADILYSQLVFAEEGEDAKKKASSEHKYRDDGWNSFPEVEPPEDVPMRIEYEWDNDEHDRGVQRTAWVFREGEWYWYDGRSGGYPVNMNKRNIRFRRWD